MATTKQDRARKAGGPNEKRTGNGAAHPVLVSGYKLAVHFGCSRQNVDQLTAQGVIERRGSDGLFDQDISRLRYFEHLRSERKQTPRAAVDSAFTAAKTRLVEMRVAEKAGKLIPGEQHDARCEEIIGTFLACLSSMPAQVAVGDLPMRRRLERWVYDTRLSMGKTLLAKADADGEPPL